MSKVVNKVAIKVSTALRAGLMFPPGKIRQHFISLILITKEYSDLKYSKCGFIYLAAVVEYLMAEILELAGSVARTCKRSRVTIEHINKAILQDTELSIIYTKFIEKPETKYAIKYDYCRYSRIVLKQVHPDLVLAQDSQKYLNKLINYTLDMLAFALPTIINKKIVTSRDIQTLVRLQLTYELTKHAVSEATKAIVKYTSSKA